MITSEILNIILGGGLVGTVVAIVTLKATVKKAKAEAMKAEAAAESMRIDNAESATRILMDNIVEPLKKELSATRREMVRLRKALDGANDCEHRAGCPVLHELREFPKPDGDESGNEPRGKHGQRRKAQARSADDGYPTVRADPEDTGS